MNRLFFFLFLPARAGGAQNRVDENNNKTNRVKKKRKLILFENTIAFLFAYYFP
jgi:hypothetical protein